MTFESNLSFSTKYVQRNLVLNHSEVKNLQTEWCPIDWPSQKAQIKDQK